MTVCFRLLGCRFVHCIFLRHGTTYLPYVALFRRRLSAEGAKPESNNRWKSDLGHVCMYVCMWVGMYGIWNYLASQGT